jgi:NADH-quinone oxidoreductase subunit C
MVAPANPETTALYEEVRTALTASFGAALLASEVAYDFPVFTVERSALFEVLKYLKEAEDIGFSFLTTLAGLHYPDQAGRELGLMYQLHDLPRNRRVRIKTFFPQADAFAPSITSLWPAANWMERQEYDFFGIVFQGHPDLRRILNMDDVQFFPLRKDFPLEDPTRDDKDDSMFGR